MEHKDPSRFRVESRTTSREVDYRRDMEQYIADAAGTLCEKMENFPKFVSRQSMARYMALYEIFKLVVPVQGSIVECGVNWGGGLMMLAQLSAMLEPVNLQRRIIGFDTFAGFAELDQADLQGASANQELKKGGYAADSFEDLQRCISLYDANRFIGHVPKVCLVKGDASQEIPRFLEQHPYTVVSLLHLDFDVYEPTKVAIEHFVPRMPKGAIIIFDELNNTSWPGETRAVLDSMKLGSLRIQRFPFEPHISYAVLE
ncbi:MAG TPA: TylF/MycF/NovP-related O-methyltransferase [Noviherbaspirillum sp.]|nr:TylF/MycF/NovP-related O-methyltransferase [Noviherbaspirillum sp.]